MSVSKPTIKPNMQGTKTGRFDSRRPNVSQPPRPSSYGGGGYSDIYQQVSTSFEDSGNQSGGGYESSDSGNSDSGSCGTE